MSSPTGDFALTVPGLQVPATDFACEWVITPPDVGNCRVEVEVSYLSPIPGNFATIQVTDRDTGVVLHETTVFDGSLPPVLTSSGSGGLVVRYTIPNAAIALIIYGGLLASHRSVCPELPEDAALLSALYGPNSTEAADILQRSLRGGSVLVVLEGVNATGNVAAQGSGGVLDLQLPQGASQQQERSALVVIAESVMARTAAPRPVPTAHRPPTLRSPPSRFFPAR